MIAGGSVVRYLVTGLAVLATTVVAGVVTRNLLSAVIVAVVWAGVLGRRELRRTNTG